MEMMRRAWLQLRGLNHPFRILMANVLIERPGLNQTQLMDQLKVEGSKYAVNQPVVSLHIGIMIESGVVKSKYKGSFRHYYINEKTLFRIHKAIRNAGI